jgi:hypothetical protein
MQSNTYRKKLLLLHCVGLWVPYDKDTDNPDISRLKPLHRLYN